MSLSLHLNREPPSTLAPPRIRTFLLLHRRHLSPVFLKSFKRITYPLLVVTEGQVLPSSNGIDIKLPLSCIEGSLCVIEVAMTDSSGRHRNQDSGVATADSPHWLMPTHSHRPSWRLFEGQAVASYAAKAVEDPEEPGPSQAKSGGNASRLVLLLQQHFDGWPFWAAASLLCFHRSTTKASGSCLRNDAAPRKGTPLERDSNSRISHEVTLLANRNLRGWMLRALSARKRRCLILKRQLQRLPLCSSSNTFRKQGKSKTSNRTKRKSRHVVKGLYTSPLSSAAVRSFLFCLRRYVLDVKAMQNVRPAKTIWRIMAIV